MVAVLQIFTRCADSPLAADSAGCRPASGGAREQICQHLRAQNAPSVVHHRYHFESHRLKPVHMSAEDRW